MKTQNKKATHTTPAKSAKLETPKRKLAAAPTPEHHKVIRAESFELVDAQGNERARLNLIGGHAVLAMHDSRGKLRLTMRAGDDTAILTIFNDHNKDNDVVERVQIGYGEGVHHPSIIISDGNRNACVSIAAGGACGSGQIFLTMPGSVYTSIDGAGLSIYTKDDETLAEYCTPEAGADDPVEDRPAPTLSTETTRDTIDEVAIRGLVKGFLPHDNDEAAKAFIALIHVIAYNDDWNDRDSLAIYASDAAYQRTLAYGNEALKFFDNAEALDASRDA